MRRVLILTMLSATLALAGCPKRDAVKETPATSGESTSSTEGLESTGVESGTGTAAGSQPGERAKLEQRVIYFDFDSSEIRPEFRDLVAAHARNLAANPALKVRLEGNTDERGSREYNIGLGERRAQTVRRALMLQGSGDSQIVTVSYGEERPAVTGNDESAWSKNRRVEIVSGN